ncbi:MAG: DUF3025 domain-containing protein [Alteromonadaceae bacterium]|nr:DUF3025 domain-containing protein [Alteromonadaceae bacterium]
MKNHSETWHLAWTSDTPFQSLTTAIDFSCFNYFPTPVELTKMASQIVTDFDYQFVEQIDFAGRYYEQVIYEDRIIPTRLNNWHDFFNACIWMLFPHSKSLLNQLHISDITTHGLNPRTPARNRITHFDECGGVLLYQDETELALLQEHQWTRAFYENRAWWGKRLRFINFGHANYEMLLNPFLGLTGKCIPVKANASVMELESLEMYKCLDTALAEELKSGSWFAKRGNLKPLPLLGIPNWDARNAHPEFYDNRDYFRPLRSTKE